MVDYEVVANVPDKPWYKNPYFIGVGVNATALPMFLGQSSNILDGSKLATGALITMALVGWDYLQNLKLYEMYPHISQRGMSVKSAAIATAISYVFANSLVHLAASYTGEDNVVALGLLGFFTMAAGALGNSVYDNFRAQAFESTNANVDIPTPLPSSESPE